MKYKSFIKFQVMSGNKNKGTSSFSEESKSDSKPNKNHKVCFSEKIFKHDYMKKFIAEIKAEQPKKVIHKRKSGTMEIEEKSDKNEKKFKCTYCKEELYVNSLKPHIFTEKHMKNTPNHEHEKLQELRSVLNSKLSEDLEKVYLEEKSSYLEFISFAMSEKLSFSQISRLGKYLQRIYSKNKLSFLDLFNFDAEELSKVSRNCLGVCLLDELKEKLRSNPYSFCIDASTISGENCLAIKVKYFDPIERQDPIQNRTVGIFTLQESSNSETIFNAVKEKLFTEDKIKNNFISITHDHASTLSGLKTGLVARLREEKADFFDLKDPCHSFNLVVNNSLKVLPEQIKQFIKTIHKHFKNSPQRKAKLKKIQIDKNLNPLLLKQYVVTRWLSLGDCLTRLLDLWEILKEYFSAIKEEEKSEIKLNSDSENEIDEEGRQQNEQCNEDNDDGMQYDKMDYKSIYECLSSNYFKLQLSFLCFVIRKINGFNIRLQDPKLNPATLKSELYACYDVISSLILDQKNIQDENLAKRLELNWENKKKSSKALVLN